ncbi:MAG TPA: SRPBCC domain-containing protein [Acetobacteraceae bacterium]
MSAKPSLTLKRRLNARPASVFAAWTDPEKMMRWWGPTGAEMLRAETDVRVGGRFRVVFRTPDHEEHDVSGVYRKVVPDEKLVFTWAWRTTPERESLVTVALRPDGSGTLLTLTHEQFFDEAARDRHRDGWTGTLDKLERMFA